MTTEKTNRPEHPDVWLDWLLQHRHGSDPEYAQVVRATIESYAQRVIEGAQLKPGMTMLDVGAGDGLVAFRAIDQFGPSLKAILTDISVPLLQHAEQLARDRGIAQQCTFIQGSAELLSSIDSESVDAVTTRSSFAYVRNKVPAMREFYRTLKPGGRLSMAEPILRDDGIATIALRQKLDALPTDSTDRILPLLHRWKAAQYPDTLEKLEASEITNYSERDLIKLAKICGFSELKLELHILMLPSRPVSWEVFLATSPHPLAPCLKDILEMDFSIEERALFESAVRPRLEIRDTLSTDRMAYLTATKPMPNM
jgi:ubiquinone/menaquinone biosynthesis C-methylase UbiE